MSLHKRTILVIGLITSVAMVLAYLSIGYLFMKYFSDSEQQSLERDVRWARYVIGQDIDSMDRQVLDWSQWDDMYAFATDRNEEFVRSNMAPESLRALGISYIVITDADGEVLAYQGLNLKTGEEIPLPADIRQQFRPGSVLSTFSSPDAGQKGIVSFSVGPAFVAARPILTTLGQGPPRGTVAFIKVIDDGYSDDLSVILGHSFQFSLFGSGNFPADFREAARYLASTDDTYTNATGKIVSGYGVLDDVFGSPFLYYKVDRVMGTHEGIGKFLFFLAVILGVAGTSACAVLLIVLYRTIFLRIRYLNDVFSSIRSKGLGSVDVTVEGNDDLSRLSREISEMFRAALRVRRHGDIAEKRFETISDNIPAMVWMIGMDHRCVYVNRQSKEVAKAGKEEDFVAKWNALIHSEDISGCLQRCNDAFEARKPVIMEYRVHGSKERYRWILDHGVPYHSSDGVLLGFLHVAFDITDRKNAEQSEKDKRKEAERLSAIMVSRELRMIELKNEIKSLRSGTGTKREA